MCETSTEWKRILTDASSNVPLKHPICATSLLVTSKKYQATSSLIAINDSFFNEYNICQSSTKSEIYITNILSIYKILSTMEQGYDLKR